jgi:hypothetical protein
MLVMFTGPAVTSTCAPMEPKKRLDVVASPPFSPELVPYPNKDLVQSSRHLLGHAADLPLFLPAMTSRPDWLLTHNTKHFTKAIAQGLKLRITTPAEFFRALSALFR